MAEEDLKKLIVETAAENRRLIEESARQMIEESAAENRRLIEDSAAENRRLIEQSARQMIEESAAETRRLLESLDNKIDDNRRHAEIVAENLDHKIQLVAEVTSGKIESLRHDMNEDFANVDRRFNDLEGAMGFAHGELVKRVDDHETRIQRLETTHRPS